MDISVLIPAYNGGNIIKDLFLRIKEVLSGKYTFEVLFIFDNGKDNTWRIIKGLKNDYPDLIKAYHLAKNYGQHRAIQFGMGQALGKFVITLDEDLQHDPADILKLIEKQKTGNYEVVYGKFTNLRHSGIKNWLSSLLRKTLKQLIPNLYDNYSPYRLIKREIALSISNMVNPYILIDDFLSRITKNVAFEEINHHKRMEGRSSYTFAKLIKQGIYLLLAYSKLVQWLLIVSIAFLVTGLILLTINIISAKQLTAGLVNNRTIIGIVGVGVILLSISAIGALKNRCNTILNTEPISLINEGSI